LWIKGIDRRHAWTMISTRCKSVGLKWNFGWHTLRKTRWYQSRIQWVALEPIQHKLNHSSLSVTKRYLGITDDEIQDVCNKLDL
jgi:site-specific recombinase XerD